MLVCSLAWQKTFQRFKFVFQLLLRFKLRTSLNLFHKDQRYQKCQKLGVLTNLQYPVEFFLSEQIVI